MSRKASNIVIKEIKTAAEWRAIYPLIRQLNPGMKRPDFDRLLKHIRAQDGYRCIGAYRGGTLAGITGIWSSHRFWCGKYMEIDNFVVDQRQRSAGIGKLLNDWVEKEAKKGGCNIVIADSYSYNHASHRFYMRERYILKGFCFVKELGKTKAFRQ
jgi:GNAT superfamily N-acetyltransferase